VEDWAEVRRLHRAEGMPIKAIARQLGIGRNTVRRALAADGPPCYQRPAKGSAVVLGGVCGWGWCVAWGWFGDRAGGVVRIGWVRIGVIAPGAVRPGTMWNCSPIIVVVRFV
jgi:hypothetical protein